KPKAGRLRPDRRPFSPGARTVGIALTVPHPRCGIAQATRVVIAGARRGRWPEEYTPWPQMPHRPKLTLSLPDFLDEVRDQQNAKQHDDGDSRAEVSLYAHDFPSAGNNSNGCAFCGGPVQRVR